MCNVKLQVS